MAKIAFLGLGQMGAPMAARLLAAGHDLVVWNRTASKTAALVERGARPAPTPRQAVAEREVVITMLASPEALETVAFGPNGIGAGLDPDATWIEMSTVGPEAVRRMAAGLPAGVHWLDAPVLGSVPQAQDGTLRIFVGGESADFERWRPLLAALGQPVHVGPAGTAAALKLVINSTLGVLMTALGEAISLADGLGVDARVALDALADSPLGVTTRSKREHVLSGTYPPRFKLQLAVKDLRLVAEAAADAGRAMPLAAAARAWFEAAARAQLGELDYSAVVAHIRGQPAKPPG